MNQIIKYPRTPHLEGSRIQLGDKREVVSLDSLNRKMITIEEKVDGANSAISFQYNELYLQSRGHYLSGGPREKHFDLFKAFAARYVNELHSLLGNKYIMYGEWMFSLHAIFYNSLPSYFLEFDIYDKEEKTFLSTEKRKDLLKKYEFINSVPVLKTFDNFDSNFELNDLICKSKYIQDNQFKDLKETVEDKKLNYDRVLENIDKTNIAEGLYIKWEENGKVKGRYKYVRKTFLQAVEESETHWLNRPIIPNKLSYGIY